MGEESEIINERFTTLIITALVPTQHDELWTEAVDRISEIVNDPKYAPIELRR